MVYTEIKDLLGEHVIPILKYLENKKDVSEFKIAEDLKMEIHLIRNILYNLNGQRLITYIRKKDRIKGWYISYWTLNPKGIEDIKPKIKLENYNKLKERIKYEESHQFYLCKNMCSRLSFEKAFEVDFKCQECGELMNFQDNTRTIEFLKQKLEKMELELNQ